MAPVVRAAQWLWRRIAPTPDAPTSRTILLAFAVGAIGGVGALVFGLWIQLVRAGTLDAVIGSAVPWLMVAVPAAGLLLVSWLALRFAPETQGHGVPEVISAVARKGGVIRPRVALFKTLASGLTIGTGGSVGREGPIVQIGSAAGSLIGQWSRLPQRNVKVLVASGAAAGISATFGAPLAGVMFAAEVILGNFAVSFLTPIVIAAVIANLVAQKGLLLLHDLPGRLFHLETDRIVDQAQRVLPVFWEAREFSFRGAHTLPLYLALGLLCGVAAVSFTKLLYRVEDFARQVLPRWWVRALAAGLLVGCFGLWPPLRPLYGVGYDAVKPVLEGRPIGGEPLGLRLLLALFVLKYLTTSVTLAGGGSGGIFAPSLFLGCMLGGAFGLLAARLFPHWGIQPGTFSVAGMSAVVAGTTHGPLSAVLILFEMTNDYDMILPLMCAAGRSAVTATAIDPESIYLKKLSRRGELPAWGHHTTGLEDVTVRQLMITSFPSVKESATLREIVEAATRHPHVENLPVMSEDGALLGVIRTEDLHRLLDSDMQPSLVRAHDIVQPPPTRLHPDDNLLEALRSFGMREDVESLPVEVPTGDGTRLVGLLPRWSVMRRYRQEMLKHRSRPPRDPL